MSSDPDASPFNAVPAAVVALAAAEADCALLCPAGCGAEAAWVDA